jgi:hypothetical protein
VCIDVPAAPPDARDAMLHGGMLRVVATNEVVAPGQLAESTPAARLVHLVITDTLLTELSAAITARWSRQQTNG